MGEHSQRVGAKAGGCVGFVWGIAQAVIIYISTPSFQGIFNSRVAYALSVAVGGAIVISLLGMLFVRIEGRLPGRSMIVKGIGFMLMLWVILRGFVVLWLFGLGGLLQLLPSALTLISYASAGAGLGYLVKKFAK